MRYFSVKNFERWQHYKDRRPVWIKVYNSLLSDYAFSQIPDAVKWHLIGIWLLASQHGNRLPFDGRWIGERIGATVEVDLEMLLRFEFIESCEDASKSLAGCYQDASVEKRREETEKNSRSPNGEHAPTGAESANPAETREDEPDGSETLRGFESFWRDWPAHFRKRGKSKCFRHWKHHRLERIAGQVIAALGRCKASGEWHKQDGQFIPMPLTWLNQTPWETEPAEMVGGDDAGGNGCAVVTGWNEGVLSDDRKPRLQHPPAPPAVG